ncbi:anaerobic C4-dicarboxylate transporter family protein [Streptomyces sp. NPDC006512]|uniref:anaerobic C4-dicarboxylate transporter family protein n=1 Tax=Streptomyces sp. NPDC006512 TaxID=3154307 RepID=UPI0033A513EB
MAATVQARTGRDLHQDPGCLRMPASGEIEPPAPAGTGPRPAPPRARWSAYLFLGGTAAVVVLSFIGADKARITGALGGVARTHPWFSPVMLLLLSALPFGQATTAKALMPPGPALGIPDPLIAAWPAVNGSFMLPGLVTTCVAVSTGFALVRII